MFRKVVGSSVLLSAAPIAVKEKVTPETPNLATFRPQELPIYTTIFAKDTKKYIFGGVEKDCSTALFWMFVFHIYSATTADQEPSAIRASFEGGVKVVRETCCDTVNAIKDKKKPVDEFIATGIEHSQCKFL